jgi:NADH dehydrogenase
VRVPDSAAATRPRVLVLGGGFAGVGTTQKLKDSDVDVVLVDKHNYHTFQPLLYQFATGLLEQTGVGHSLRDLVKKQDNARVHQVTVTAIDLDAREVQFAEMEPLGYDYLVLGLGAEVNFFGVAGAPEHAFPLYTLPHAVRLKDHVLARWEEVDRQPDLVDDGALTIVVVGGGPTGVESAGALAELYRGVLSKDYPDLPQDKARIVLVEAGPTLFPMFKENLREYTEKALTDRTVEVMVGEVVESISPTRVKLKSGTVIEAHTLVWGAGLQGNASSVARAAARARQCRRRPRPTRRRPGGVRGGGHRGHHGRRQRSSQLRVRCAPVGDMRARHRGSSRQGARAFQVPRQGHHGDDRPGRRRRPDARRANDQGQEGPDGLGDGAPRAAADERGSREGGRGVGGGGLHAPAGGPDLGRRRVAHWSSHLGDALAGSGVPGCRQGHGA